MRIARRLLLVVAVLLVLGAALLVVSSRTSLDTDLRHTRRAESLRADAPPASAASKASTLEVATEP